MTTQPPDSIAAGAAFGLVVTAENADGSVNTSFNGPVTISSDTTVVGGTTTVNAVNGVAAFSGLTIDTAGANYLLATAAGITSAWTNGITVTPGAATQLVVPVPNGNVLDGSSFSISALAEDPYGNVAQNFNGNVALTLTNDVSGAVLGGTLAVSATSGVASFSPLTINEPGSAYTLQATGSGLAAGVSLPFAVTDQLVVATQPPTSVSAGSTFGLTVAVEDGQGNINAAFTGSVTLDLTNNATGAYLGGTPTVTAVNGVATFSGLTIDTAGSGYTLQAISNGLSGVASSAFNVTAAAATQLVVPAGSTNILTGASFGLQVSAEDPFGNVDSNFNGSVALALTSSAGAPLWAAH